METPRVASNTACVPSSNAFPDVCSVLSNAVSITANADGRRRRAPEEEAKEGLPQGQGERR